MPGSPLPIAPASLPVGSRSHPEPGAATAASGPGSSEAVYARYTVDRYHSSLRSLVALKRWYGLALLVMMGSTAFIFVGVREPHSLAGAVLQWLTVAWLLPVFHIPGGFKAALLTAIIVWLTGLVGSWFIGHRGIERFARR